MTHQGDAVPEQRRAPSGGPRRIAFYSHDAQGPGHIRRNIALAGAVAAAEPDTDILLVAERTVDLTAREFVLLELFLRHPDQVLSREQILSHVWGYDFDPGSNVVDVYVRALRKKIGPERIGTVRGMGYRLGNSG